MESDRWDHTGLIREASEQKMDKERSLGSKDWRIGVGQRLRKLKMELRDVQYILTSCIGSILK